MPVLRPAGRERSLAAADELAVARDRVDAVGDHRVAAGAAADHVARSVAREDAIRSCASVDQIAARTARDAVIPGAAEEAVVAAAPVDPVGAGGAAEDVRTVASGPGAAGHGRDGDG